MNVCMLVWKYWPIPAGGAEAQCRKLSKSLFSEGVHCTVLTARLQLCTPAKERDGNLTIVRIAVPQIGINRLIAWRDRFFLKKKELVNPFTSLLVTPKTERKSTRLEDMVCWINCLAFITGATLWLIFHRRKIDLIHVHIGEWIAGFGGWIGAFLGTPVICKASDMPALPRIGTAIPFYSAWDGWRRKIAYVALHQDIKKELVDCGVAAEKIFLIPNGVDIPICTAEPGHGDYVLFVGNFTQGSGHKGFDVLFKAWAKVCSQLPDARLVMAGNGDSSPWQQLVDHLGCSDNVHFAGYVHCMEDLYQQAALLTLPSLHEGMSNALLEAQAWGLPAVVSDIPGNRAVVENEITGKIVPVGDHVALAQAIIELLKDPQTRAEMGREARKRIEDQFGLDKVAGQYKALYNSLIDQEPVRS